MSDQDEQFENTDAGASMTEKVESQRLKNGSLVMVKGFPCKVTEVSTAKPGKHGSAKVIIKAKDILSAKVYECTFHSGDMIDAPIVKRTEYTLLNIEEDQLQLLDAAGEMKEDVNLPEDEHLREVAQKIKDIFEEGKRECLVTVIATLGKEQVVDVREGAEVWRIETLEVASFVLTTLWDACVITLIDWAFGLGVFLCGHHIYKGVHDNTT